MKTSRETHPTRTRLLDAAQERAQRLGFNAFSFKDLAQDVGIRTASVHHHFPTKADLGRALMVRYREDFLAQIERIDATQTDPLRKLERFADLFRDTLRADGRLCLCGMLAAEVLTLPPEMQEEVRAFFRDCERWLARVLQDGREQEVFRLGDGTAAQVAATYLAMLEGASIAARAFGDEERLFLAARWLLGTLGIAARPGAERPRAAPDPRDGDAEAQKRLARPSGPSGGPARARAPKASGSRDGNKKSRPAATPRRSSKEKRR